jgi:hypothetical protein
MAKHGRTGQALAEFNARKRTAQAKKPSAAKRKEARAKKFPKKDAS